MPSEFLTPTRLHRINPDEVVSLVEELYGYEQGTLRRTKNQASRFAHPRHLIAFLLLEQGLSTTTTGRVLGKHHTTVISSREVIIAAMETDEEVADLVNTCRAAISGNAQRFTKPAPEMVQLWRARRDEYLRAKEAGEDPPPAPPAPPRKPITRAPLPDVATHSIPGMAELDTLIVNGRGDEPRLSIEQLRKPAAKLR